MKIKSLFFLFLSGCIVGTLLDAFHVVVGIATYTHPFFMQQAWWVPLIFGAATLLIGVSHFKLHPMPGSPPTAFWGSFVFFVSSYFVTATLPALNQINAFIVFIFYLISWGLFDRTLVSIVLALITAIIGCTIESSLGWIGQYHYTTPDFFRVPFWLPALYLNASAAGGFLGRLFLSRKP